MIFSCQFFGEVAVSPCLMDFLGMVGVDDSWPFKMVPFFTEDSSIFARGGWGDKQKKTIDLVMEM